MDFLKYIKWIFFILHVIQYSCIKLKLLVFSLTANTNTYVKIWMSRGQYAWLVGKHLLASHQRLNEKHFSTKESSNNYNNNRISFEQWLVGFTDGGASVGNFHISKQKSGDTIK